MPTNKKTSQNTPPRKSDQETPDPRGRWQNIIELANIGLGFLTPDFKIVWGNPIFKNILDKDKGISLDTNPECILLNGRFCVDCELEALAKGEKEAARCEKSFEINGKVEWWNIIAQAIKGPDNKVINLMIALFPITERKLAELELREQKDLYQQLVDASPFGIGLCDTEGKIVLASPELLKILGYDDGKQLIGRNVIDWVSPDEREIARNRMGQMTAGYRQVPRTYECLHGDGTRFFAHVIANPIYDDKGKVKYILTIVNDVSDKIKHEKERIEIQRQLGLSSRLNSVGILAKGIAQELNNPLTIIQTGLEVLRKGPENYLSRVETIQNAVDRIQRIISRIGEDTDSKVGPAEEFDAHDLIKKAVYLMASLHQKEKMSIITNLEAEQFSLMGRTYLFEQVLINLFTNAKEAIQDKGGGVVTVKT
ncbi:MAG: PAS domain S-box protein, partial [Pseudomonadota bacterium]